MTSVENSSISLNEKFIQNFMSHESDIQNFTQKKKKWNGKSISTDLSFLVSRVLPTSN